MTGYIIYYKQLTRKLEKLNITLIPNREVQIKKIISLGLYFQESKINLPTPTSENARDIIKRVKNSYHNSQHDIYLFNYEEPNLRCGPK